MKTRLPRSIRAWLFWAVVLVLIGLDWHASKPHDRFTEPPPIALGNGPAADAGHCSLAPTPIRSR